MIRLVSSVALVSLGVWSSGCDRVRDKLMGASASTDASAVDAASNTASGTPKRVGPIEDACVHLTPAMVAQVAPETANKTFEVDDSLERLRTIEKGNAPAPKAVGDYRVLSMRMGLGRMCSYSWPKPNAAEIRARNEAKSKELVAKAMRGGKQGDLAGGLMAGLSLMESDRTTVALSFINDSASASEAIAKADYDARLKQLREGMAGKDMADATKIKDPAVAKQLNGMKLPPDTTLTDVAGVGDGAAWSSKSKVLHVLSGKRSFTVSVDIADDQNQARAVQLAKHVVAGL
jgi:hypothetical protein